MFAKLADKGPVELPSRMLVLPCSRRPVLPGAVGHLVLSAAPRGRGIIRQIATALQLRRFPFLALVSARAEFASTGQRRHLCRIGCVVRVLEMGKWWRGGERIDYHAICRVKLELWRQTWPSFIAQVTAQPDPEPKLDRELAQLTDTLADEALRAVRSRPFADAANNAIAEVRKNPYQLADLIASNLDSTTDQIQELLETADPKTRVRKVTQLVRETLMSGTESSRASTGF